MNFGRLATPLSCASLVVVCGCATTAPATPGDPWEGMNRAVFSFNEALDAAVLKPVATGYQKVVPQVVRTGVHNVFGNIGDAWSAVNQLLQGKPTAALEMTLRFGVNTVLGFGGFVDIASEAGLERRSEDFGQTLGRWGAGPGPFVVLPLLGPSTLRDTAALPADLSVSPTALPDKRSERLAVGAVQMVSTRAQLLSVTQAIDQIALDKYALVRDGFLARRRNQVYDGNPPEEPEPPEEPPEGGAAPPPQK